MREIISADRVFQFKEVYSILEQVEQFDWVDFFLFEKFPDGWTTQSDKMDSHFLIKCSDLLVRGVDNCYIFIYTPNEKVIEIIKNNYSDSDILGTESKLLEEYRIPF